MLLLFETPAGFSLFKVKDEKKLDDVEVRVRDAIGGFLFRRPAARVNCGFYDSFDSFARRVYVDAGTSACASRS